MTRMIHLDGVPLALDVDHVEVDLAASGLQPSDHADDPTPDGPWQALMSFQDGSTLYLAPNLAGLPSYKVTGPRPRRWIVAIEGRTARLRWVVG